MISSRDALLTEFFNTLVTAAFPSDSRANIDKRRRFFQYVGRISNIAGAAAGIIPGAGPVRVAAGAITELASQADDHLRHLQSVELIRNDIIRSTQALEKPVVILIDDIDRLDPEEVLIMLQTIKGCADFPNISYLLTYDQDHVFKCLSSDTRDAESYMDKIVGIQFEVPEFTPEQRKRVLNDLIDKRMQSYGNLTPQQIDRYIELKELVFLPYFKTLRQFKRFLNSSFIALLKVVPSQERPHVDIPDFLAVQFLKLYATKAYLGLLKADSLSADYRSTLPRGRQDLFLDTLTSPDNVIQGLDPETRPLIRQTFRLLSPDHRLGDSPYQIGRFHTSYWRKVFTGYSNNRATIPPGEWTQLIEAARTNRGEFWLLEQWRMDGNLDIRFDTISLRIQELDEQSGPQLLHYLLRWYGQAAFESVHVDSEELSALCNIIQVFLDTPEWNDSIRDIISNPDAVDYAALLAYIDRCYISFSQSIPDMLKLHAERLSAFLKLGFPGREIEKCYALRELLELGGTFFGQFKVDALRRPQLIESLLTDLSKISLLQSNELQKTVFPILLGSEECAAHLPPSLKTKLQDLCERYRNVCSVESQG